MPMEYMTAYVYLKQKELPESVLGTEGNSGGRCLGWGDHHCSPVFSNTGW